MARYRAIEKGYYDDRIRNEDDEFEAPDGMTATWFVPAGEVEAAPVVEADPVEEEDDDDGVETL